MLFFSHYRLAIPFSVVECNYLSSQVKVLQETIYYPAPRKKKCITLRVAKEILKTCPWYM